MLNQIRTYPNARISLIWVTAALAGVAGTWTSTSASRASAVAAGSGVIRETGNLHKISHNGASFTERGSASGTFSGTMTLYLTITGTGVTFTMNGSLPGGTLSARGSADIKSDKKIATVLGTAAFTGGSGRFAHAHGSGLTVGGTFNRETYALSITVDGRLSY
jgi:hypothetical protein